MRMRNAVAASFLAGAALAAAGLGAAALWPRGGDGSDGGSARRVDAYLYSGQAVPSEDLGEYDALLNRYPNLRLHWVDREAMLKKLGRPAGTRMTEAMALEAGGRVFEVMGIESPGTLGYELAVHLEPERINPENNMPFRPLFDCRLSLQPGDRAPDFEAETLDGGNVSLSDYRGKVLVLDFWSTGCPPCVVERPALNRLYEKFAGRGDGFAMLGVALDEDAGRVRSFAEARGIAYQQICDERGYEGPLARAYEVGALPRLFVVGGDGRVAGKYGLELSAPEGAERLVEELLGK